MSGETRREAKRMARKARISERVSQAGEAQETEAHKVYLWRLRVLTKAGLPPQIAKPIADSEFDLHKAEEMLAAGCSHDTLLRIAL